MNREILFKGFHPCENGKDKVFINGEWIKDEWIEGYYVCVGGKHHYILTGKLDITKGHLQYVHYLVIPETVGQYTGLTDKNRKKIFERDIIAYKEKIYTVDWCEDCASFVLPCINYPELETDFRSFYGADLEVIGNIYDKPGLLEVAK